MNQPRRRTAVLAVFVALVAGVGTVIGTTARVARADTGANELVSFSSGGGQGSTDAVSPDISGDGRYVVFATDAALVPSDTNGVADIYRRDRQTGTTVLVSVPGGGGGTGNGASTDPHVSADGSIVAFASTASNMVPGDSNDVSDVFIRDMSAGKTTVASYNADLGQLGNGGSFHPAVSANGLYVAFSSDASNLYNDDTNGVRDVFRFDRRADAIDRVSVSANDGEATDQSDFPSISADGSSIAFQSLAPLDVEFDQNSSWDVYVRVLRPNLNTTYMPYSVPSGPDGDSTSPSISADGQRVAFVSSATNLGVSDGNGSANADAYLYDRSAGSLRIVSTTWSGQQSSAPVVDAAISADGMTVAFTAVGDDVVGGDTNGHADVFQVDVRSGVLTRDSLSSDGAQGTGAPATSPSLSGDGRYVAYSSAASGLDPLDSNSAADIFVHQLPAHLQPQGSSTVRLSESTGGTQAAAGGFFPHISADGVYLAFTSDSPDLVGGDTNGVRDVFVKNRVTGKVVRVSVATDGSQSDNDSENPYISADGRFVAFESLAELAPEAVHDGPLPRQIYIRDRDTDGNDVFDEPGGVSTRLVSVSSAGAGPADSDCLLAGISGDGSIVVFNSTAGNLDASTIHEGAELDGYKRDVPANLTTMLTAEDGFAVGGSVDDVSYDGSSFAITTSYAFDSADSGSPDPDVYVIGDTGIHLESVSTGGTKANGPSGQAHLSRDGRFVSFVSGGTNLVSGDTNSWLDLFVRDRDLSQSGVLDTPGNTSTVRVSLTSAGGQLASQAFSGGGSMSLDGRHVAFVAKGAGVVPGFVGADEAIFVRDRDGNADGTFDDDTGSDTTVLASRGFDGHIYAGDSAKVSLSGDGRFAAFESSATLTPGDSNGESDVFVRDLAGDLLVAGQPSTPVDRATVRSNGHESYGGGSFNARDEDMSPDGRYVAFDSTDDRLYPGASGQQIYLYDRVTGAVDLVSQDAEGTPGDANSMQPKVSRDGRYVMFSSYATNLGEQDEVRKVLVRDRLTRTTTVVSASTSESPQNGDSSGLDITPDGRFVLFVSRGTAYGQDSLDTSDPDLFVYDANDASVTPVWQNAATEEPSQLTGTISDDGRCVTVETGAPYVASDTNGLQDVYMIERADQTAELISKAPGGGSADDSSHDPQISGDGETVAYVSFASNLVAGDGNETLDVFTYSESTHANTLASRASGAAGAVGDAQSRQPRLSDDGRMLVFQSAASNLVPRDTNGQSDVFLRDLAKETTTMVSLAWDGRQGVSLDTETGENGGPAINEDGTAVLFSSHAAEFAPDDENNATDLFVVQLPPPPPVVTPDVENLSLSADKQTVGAGLAAVPLSSIPLEKIPGLASQMQATDVGNVNMASSPISSIPISSIGLESANFDPNALDQIPLSSIPIDWDAILQGTSLEGLDKNTLTLKDVFDNAQAKQRFASAAASIPLSKLGVDRNILRGASLASISLGSAPISSIPAPGTGGWCPILQGFGYDCTSVDLSHTTVLGLDLAGAPISSIPISSIPISSIPISSIPISSIPISSISMNSAIGSIPISSISNPDAVVNCSRVSCNAGDGRTLSDAATANAIRPNATLQALAGAFGDITLGQVLVALLARSDFPWETIPVGSLTDAVGAPSVTYREQYDFTCMSPLSVTSEVQAPNGFHYIPGSARFTYQNSTSVAAPDPSVSGSSLTWSSLPGSPCTSVTMPGPVPGKMLVSISFQMHAALGLGTYSSSAKVTENGVVLSKTGVAPVQVVENFEPNDDSSHATPIQPDELVISHLSGGNDTDYYSLTVPPGRARWSFSLYDIPAGADFDLQVYGPQQRPLQSSPISSIPISSIPIEDKGMDTHGDDAAAPETLADVPISSIDGRRPSAVSANRDNASESASFVTNGAAGNITIRVSGYNGSSSSQPYVLRAWTYGPPPLPVAPPRTFAFDGDAWGGNDEAQTQGTLPATVSTTTRTLFLVNQDRLNDLYGSQATQSLMAQLNVVAARSEVAGAVLPVDGSAAVRSAYAAWDGNPNSIDAANDIVRSIIDVVNGYRATLPNLKFVTIVGSDEAIPFARVADGTTLSNEIDEAGDLSFLTDGLTKSNATYASVAQGQVLTDNAYGVMTAIPWLDHQAPLPDISVARLVETPEQIQGQLQRYVTANGLVAASTALVTGYDFLSDGASDVATQMDSKVGPTNTTRLINDTWNRQNLLDEFTGHVPPPSIASVNAHYSHYLLQPASTPDRSGLVSTADVPPAPPAPGSAPLFAGNVLFTAGCHAGLSVPDSLLQGSTLAQLQDWAQTWAAQQAAVYVANTGFGYGDTQSNALTERLMTFFAKRMNDSTLSFGEAWTRALHDYFDQAGSYGAYDEKVMAEATMYGLPFYRTAAGGATTPPPAPPATAPDPVSGLQTATIVSSPTLVRHDTDRGSYWSGDDGTHVQFYRPIEPLKLVPVTVPGVTAHGALITAMSTTDVAGVDPVRARPTVDQSSQEQEPDFADSIYPANMAALTRSRAFGQDTSTLVLIAGQYRPGNPPGSSGVQRLLTSATVKVAYSTSSDFNAPQIDEFHVVETGPASVRFVGRASDDTGVTRFAALYSAGGAWQFVDMVKQPSGLWIADVTVPAGSASADLDAIAQAQDAGGNVGTSTNKGLTHPATVDTGGPSIVIRSPINGAVYNKNDDVRASYLCSDDGSAVASCAGTKANGAPIDTSVGQHAFTVTATDGAGNTTTATVRYVVQVGPPQPPKDTTPPVSQFRAGAEQVVNLSPLYSDTIPGRANDYFIGVASETVTYVPVLAGSAFVTHPALRCSADKRACEWDAALPAVPGRYRVIATAVDLAGNAESPGASRLIEVL